MSESPLAEDYLRLTEKAGCVDVSERTLIGVTGDDRASFLHNMCTNDINSLNAGQGTEAFLTTVQGKTLAHVHAVVRADDILLDTTSGQAETIIQHLDRFIIREDVTLAELPYDQLIVGGLAAPQVLAELAGQPMPDGRLDNVVWPWQGNDVTAIRYPLSTWPAFLLVAEPGTLTDLKAALVSSDCPVCIPESWETVRIEGGLPEFGRDIHSGNLPQEICRDAEAISFVKGCYLGQETVARIDALGRVNRLLVGVEVTPADLAPGVELIADDKPVGQLTSLAYSPRLGKAIGIANVRRGAHEAGTVLQCAGGEAQVRHFPLQ